MLFGCIAGNGFVWHHIFNEREKINSEAFMKQIVTPVAEDLERENLLDSTIWMQV